MWTNFLNLWILARVVQSAAAALLCLLGAVVGGGIALRWRSGQSSESQLELERRAELVGTVMQVAFILEVMGLALAVFVTDHLVGGIRGAMCAFGVLASDDAGFTGLFISVVAAVVCALWLVLHRLDLRLEMPTLTRRKFLSLWLVAPLALLELRWTVVFAYQLDFNVIASCCSVWVDDTLVSTRAARWVISPVGAGIFGLVGASLACVASVRLWRQPGRARAWVAAVISVMAGVAVLPAIVGVVAPHVLGTPAHMCPFCLFQPEGYRLGWVLFAALFVGVTAGLGAGLVEWNRRAAGDSAVVNGMERTLGCWGAWGWGCVWAAGVLPVVSYWIATGGVSVFGKI